MSESISTGSPTASARSAAGTRVAIAAGTLALLLGVQSRLTAQDFRVRTIVYDDTVGEKVPVASSLTLFHAGKAYDYLDAIHEVIVYEPVHQRFTLLNTRAGVATIAEFDQIRRMLTVAHTATEEHMQELQGGADAKNPLIDQLQFQLEPRFHERYDAAIKRLELSSPYAMYDVRCADDRPAEIVEAYLLYADWTSRLNYVLYPQMMLPDARLALNEKLREKGLFPTDVRLRSSIGPARNLHAEHRIRWELVDNDRDLILEWERQLARESTKRLKLGEYQQAVLVGQTKQR